jgi:hypothetical protein
VSHDSKQSIRSSASADLESRMLLSSTNTDKPMILIIRQPPPGSLDFGRFRELKLHLLFRAV